VSSTSLLKITQLPKLKDDGSNWGTYKDRLLNAIVAKGLRRHAHGTAKAPPDLISRDGEFFFQGRIAPLSDTELEEHEDKLDEYLQKQAQVRQIIYETVSEATFMRIKSQPNAERMLAQLFGIYENKGEMVQMDTLTRLRSMRCLDDDDVIKHITEMQRLKEALDTMGAPLADAQFAAYIKASLPEKFRPLLATIATATRLAGLDAGATRHFSPDRASFTNFVEIPPVPIRAADGRTFSATGRGDLKV
ncbi:hypothetical protein GGX14DRAFT_588402, partial [Mycena pura]